MKNIKIILVNLLLFITFNNYSQHGGPPHIVAAIEDKRDNEFRNRQNTYFKDLNGTFDKFLGTWVYSSGNHYFKITFFKTENLDVFLAVKQTEDIIQSHYEYKYNNVLKFETYTTNLSFVDSDILYDENVLGFCYQEPSLISCDKDRIGDLKLTFSLNSNNEPILSWNRTDLPVQFIPIPCPDDSQPDITDFLVPNTMVLTKL